jgi:purine nucleosidase/pyrimidine-specific ribonucleoside hydrolase
MAMTGLGGSIDIGMRSVIPPPVRLSTRNAVDEILFHLSSTPESLTLIALGPLTNIAQAIERDRGTMEKVKGIVLMGGAVTVAGNITPAAEFNMYVDPHAARVVLGAGLPLTLVGLDVTRKVRLSRETLERDVVPRQTAISQFISDCTSDLFVFCQDLEGESSFPLHDPLAVGAVVDPSLVVWESMHVDVETCGDITEGMTVADRRPIWNSRKKPANARVCLGVDASRFLSLFLERVCPA